MYEQVLQEWERLDKMCEDIQAELSELPEGNLVYSHDGKRCRFYCKDGKTQTYLSKKKRLLAENLAWKRYLRLLLEDVLHEKQALEFYLRHHVNEPLKSSRFLMEVPECRELLAPYFKPVSQELEEWMKEPYERNPKFSDYLVHSSVSGNQVRSKSEVLIDMALYRHKIPYRYECALELDGMTFYPDFTIRHPVTGETYYWEHFGQADDPKYCKGMASKLQMYMTHGMIPSINLITTYETKDTPLTLDAVEKVIEEYFLTPVSKIGIGR